jgi:hypothetical protein
MSEERAMSPSADPVGAEPRPLQRLAAFVAGERARRWPRRRVGAAIEASVALAWLVLSRTGGDLGVAPAWSALSLATVILAALALATFIPMPGQGTALDLGCGPCAVAGGLMAVGSVWFVLSEVVETGNGLLGLALAGASFVHRLSQPSTCPPNLPVSAAAPLEPAAHHHTNDQED